MSLLIKALEQAAKDREAAEKQEPTLGGAAEASSAGDAGAQRRTAKSLSGLAQIESQQRARAAAIVQPGGSGTPKVFEYLRNSPTAMIGAAAGVIGIVFGIYVYIQVAHPTMLTRTPPPAPPAQTAPPVLPSATATVTAPAPTTPPPETTVTAPPPALLPPAPPSAPALGAAAPVAGATAAPGPDKVLLDKAPQAPGPVAAASVVASDKPIAPDRGELRREPPPEAPRAARAAPVAPVQTTPPRERIVVSTGAPKPVLNPNVSAAYAAVQSGDLEQARKLYSAAAQAEPLNIDALLGLAYVAAQENRTDEAMKTYVRILQLEPRNALAQAGMIGLVGRADAVAAETRLKQLIAREPSSFLHFMLGNVYSDQGAWPQAQQAYFQAHHLEPDNADYAYNLAVSLDHLKQRKLALTYYSKAEQLAAGRGRVNFNVAQARERIRSLSTQLE